MPVVAHQGELCLCMEAPLYGQRSPGLTGIPPHRKECVFLLSHGSLCTWRGFPEPVMGGDGRHVSLRCYGESSH